MRSRSKLNGVVEHRRHPGEASNFLTHSHGSLDVLATEMLLAHTQKIVFNRRFSRV